MELSCVNYDATNYFDFAIENSGRNTVRVLQQANNHDALLEQVDAMPKLDLHNSIRVKDVEGLVANLKTDFYLTVEETSCMHASTTLNGSNETIPSVAFEHFDVSSSDASSDFDHIDSDDYSKSRSEHAFDEWLTAKVSMEKFVRKREQKTAKEERAAKKDKEELAKKSYDEWLTRKNVGAKAQKTVKSESIPEPQVTFLQANATHHSLWLKRKNRELKLRKQTVKAAEDAKISDELIRKQQSMEQYRRWLRDSRTRGKPVPMGQGLLSLRSSVSHHFVNANEWVHDLT